MRTVWVFGLALFVSFLTSSAQAIKVDSLYKSTVPVTSQATAERNQATQQALEQVMIKVSGNAQIINNPKLKTNLAAADSLIQQFSYTPQTTPNFPYLLEIEFDPSGVNQWLRDAGAAVWGQNRPLISTWVTYQAPGHEADIINSDATNQMGALLKQTADKRGLPLVFPVMDIQELNQINAKDILDMSVAKITEAAKRYSGDAILIGHITQTKSDISSQWKLVLGSNQWDWNLTGKTITDIISPLVNNVTNTLATRFAVVTTQVAQKDITLQVSGVTHPRDYAQLTRYLSHVTSVSNVEITKILSGDVVILKISLRSSPESFYQALTLDKKLTPVTTTNTANTMAVYQWNP